MVLLLEATRFSRVVSCKHKVRHMGELFRVDANAKGNDAVVGGWRTGPSPDTKTAPGFSIRLTRFNAAWALSKEEAFRTTASLESYALLGGVVLFIGMQEDSDFEGAAGFTSYTDNQSNGYLLDKLQTTKMPLATILMEVGWQLQMKNVAADLQWVLGIKAAKPTLSRMAGTMGLT